MRRFRLGLRPGIGYKCDRALHIGWLSDVLADVEASFKANCNAGLGKAPGLVGENRRGTVWPTVVGKEFPNRICVQSTKVNRWLQAICRLATYRNTNAYTS